MATSQQIAIVNLVAQLTASPVPSQLQQSGALISVGGTTLATGTYQFCSDLSAVEGILSTSGNYEELTNMATTFFAQGTAVGVYVLELGAQSTPQTGIAALQSWITANPGVFYTYCTPQDWDTLPAPASTSATASGSSGTVAAGTYYIQTAYINAEGTIGQLSPATTVTVTSGEEITVSSPPAISGATAYLVYMGTEQGVLYLQNTISGTAIGTDYVQSAAISTTTAGTSTTLADLGNQYSNPTGMTYFYVLSNSTNVASYGVMEANSVWGGYKAIVAVCPSPTAQAGEFASAAWMYNMLVNKPGADNRLAPMSYRYLYGVTPWPATGYSSEIQTIVNYGGNYVGTGAEGGISNYCIFKGTTSSLAQISAWYGLDWEMINVQQQVVAAIINGSNSNPPLDYDQTGINTLQEIAQVEADNGVTFGCALSATINAIPFATYTTQNPDDYGSGIYNGLSGSIVAQNGFLNLNFFMNLSFNA
jgi:hypothetical protein